MHKLWKNWPEVFIQNYLQKSNCYFFLMIIGLATVLFFMAVLAVSTGAVTITGQEIQTVIIRKIRLLLGQNITETAILNKAYEHIIWDIRLPRVLLGGLAGAGLAIAGVAMQAVAKNSLADPYILGISSGASTGAALVMVGGLFERWSYYGTSISAFCGALFATALVFLLSQRSGRMDRVRLILSGTAISILFSSTTSLLLYMAKSKEQMQRVVFWLMGSLGGAQWEVLPIAFIVVLVAVLFLLANARELNAMVFGEETAMILGVDSNTLRKHIVLLVAAIAGTIVSVCGMIGFVGFVIPHMVRLLVGSDHRKVIPISCLVGAIFLIECDILARSIIQPEELPIGIITALCGAPFFICILYKSDYSFGGQ